MYQTQTSNPMYSDGGSHNYSFQPSDNGFKTNYSSNKYEPVSSPKYLLNDVAEKYAQSLGSYESSMGSPTYNINIMFNSGPIYMGTGVLHDSIVETMKNTYLTNQTSKIDFSAADFLNANRPVTPVIGTTEEVKQDVESAFREVTGEEWPENLTLSVLDEEDFLKAHGENGGSYSPGILGFSLNSQGAGLNKVFVKQDNLDRMMLTIGHEIGHVMSKSLPNPTDEEAKAFSFSIAWMEKIIEKNIAGLSKCIHPSPAENGLHNVAFDFVGKILRRGSNAFELFKELVRGNVSIVYGG